MSGANRDGLINSSRLRRFSRTIPWIHWVASTISLAGGAAAVGAAGQQLSVAHDDGE
jgi:hypothetical protein